MQKTLETVSAIWPWIIFHDVKKLIEIFKGIKLIDVIHLGRVTNMGISEAARSVFKVTPHFASK
jgi:hypothetical protein